MSRKVKDLNILIYDCEIEKCIPDVKKVNLGHLDYCAGWEDYENMGISVIGTRLLSNKNISMVFVDTTIEDIDCIQAPIHTMQSIISTCNATVGFNNQHFDDKLLKANSINIPENIINYDILAEIWEAAGLGRTFVYPTHVGFSLEAICKANNLGEKSGSGELAPELWQNGKKKEVVEYCMHDIELTEKLFNLIQETGEIIDPRIDNYYFNKYNPNFEFKPLKVRKLQEMI